MDALMRDLHRIHHGGGLPRGSTNPTHQVIDQIRNDALDGVRGPQSYTLPGVRMLEARRGHSAMELPTLYVNGLPVGFMNQAGPGSLAFASSQLGSGSDVTLSGSFRNARFYIDEIA